MNLTFKRWLSNQGERPDPVGKLARALTELDLTYVPSKRNADEHKKWADIITRHGKLEHVIAFNQAWQEYQEARETST